MQPCGQKYPGAEGENKSLFYPKILYFLFF